MTANVADANLFDGRVETINGCWVWQGGTTSAGYGLIRADGRQQLVHRVSFEIHRGPIPTGLVIDHLCRVRRCINPHHLEPVTNRENILRGISPSALAAKVTHCKHGHEFTPENTKIKARSGKRSCRECERIYKRNARARAAALR